MTVAVPLVYTHTHMHTHAFHKANPLYNSTLLQWHSAKKDTVANMCRQDVFLFCLVPRSTNHLQVAQQPAFHAQHLHHTISRWCWYFN